MATTPIVIEENSAAKIPSMMVKNSLMITSKSPTFLSIVITIIFYWFDLFIICSMMLSTEHRLSLHMTRVILENDIYQEIKLKHWNSPLRILNSSCSFCIFSNLIKYKSLIYAYNKYLRVFTDRDFDNSLSKSEYHQAHNVLIINYINLFPIIKAVKYIFLIGCCF